jgi:hypothetical protein
LNEKTRESVWRERRRFFLESARRERKREAKKKKNILFSQGIAHF